MNIKGYLDLSSNNNYNRLGIIIILNSGNSQI